MFSQATSKACSKIYKCAYLRGEYATLTRVVIAFDVFLLLPNENNEICEKNILMEKHLWLAAVLDQWKSRLLRINPSIFLCYIIFVMFSFYMIFKIKMILL